MKRLPQSSSFHRQKIILIYSAPWDFLVCCKIYQAPSARSLIMLSNRLLLCLKHSCLMDTIKYVCIFFSIVENMPHTGSINIIIKEENWFYNKIKELTFLMLGKANVIEVKQIISETKCQRINEVIFFTLPCYNL